MAHIQRRTLMVIVLSQLCAGAGLAAGIAVGALLARDMLGGDSLAGLPTALFTLGSAGSAVAVGSLSQRHGRRVGLVWGFIVGAVGALAVVAAGALDSVPLLLVALLVYGAGSSTNLQARYAGADLAAPARRGTAVSIVMVSTTLGAVAGPNLVSPMGAVAEALGIPRLTGPFLLAALAYGMAALVLFVLLRPDPLLLAMARGGERAAGEAPLAVDTPALRAGRGVVVGASVMVLTQIAMVAIMTMTPVHMTAHGRSLGEVGFVIGAHIACMFLPSPLTGMLADRFGRVPVALVAALVLMASGMVAALAPGGSFWLLTLALCLLGLGWNLGLISGTALVVDAAPLHARARIQGRVDLLIALAGAGGGAMSGVVVAGAGFAALSLLGGFLSLLLVPVVVWYRRAPVAVAG
ncbi:MAG TPA: MFS transporter [Miltoncostaeaceae bacterium]|nr:MFS transporter [Miltoncostaeaceae bacterium]